MNVREMKINKNLLMTILHVNSFFFFHQNRSELIFTELYRLSFCLKYEELQEMIVKFEFLKINAHPLKSLNFLCKTHRT